MCIDILVIVNWFINQFLGKTIIFTKHRLNKLWLNLCSVLPILMYRQHIRGENYNFESYINKTQYIDFI